MDHASHNGLVVGSSPARPTKFDRYLAQKCGPLNGSLNLRASNGDGWSLPDAITKAPAESFLASGKPYRRSKWEKPSAEHDRLVLESRSVPEPMSGCTLWTGRVDPEGYGRVAMGSMGGVVKLAHRVAYELECGEIPPGMTIDHLCRTRCCINPRHLEPVSDRENRRRGEEFRRKYCQMTFCKRGHPFEGDNIRVSKNGQRKCRECARAFDRMRIAKNRQQKAGALLSERGDR